MKRKAWIVNCVWIVAPNGIAARKVYEGEYGTAKAFDIRRAPGPFMLGFDGEPSYEVSEREFCDKVQTHGGGIVCEIS